MSVRPPFALFRVLLCSAALMTAFEAVQPAQVHAQAATVGSTPDRTVFGVRILGSWLDDDDLRWTIRSEGYSDAVGSVVRESTGEEIASVHLRPGPEGLHGELRDPATGEVLNAIWRLYVDRDGSGWAYYRGKFRGVRDHTRLRRPEGHPEPAGMESWAGRWRTSRGLLRLNPQGGTFFGFLHRGEPLKEEERVALEPRDGTLVGAWEQGGEWSPTVPRGDVFLALNRDGTRFTGYYTDVTTGRRVDWTGERFDRPTPQPPAEQEPAPPADPPSPQPQPGPGTPPGTTPAPDSTPPSSFQPLRQFDVRLDRVVEARGYPTRQVHVFVTIKNASGRAQHITSGFLKALLSDADGVAQERNQVWRASGEPAALFSSTPVVQAGAELRIRYVFTPDEGSRPSSFTLMEGDRRAEFSVAGF